MLNILIIERMWYYTNETRHHTTTKKSPDIFFHFNSLGLILKEQTLSFEMMYKSSQLDVPKPNEMRTSKTKICCLREKDSIQSAVYYKGNPALKISSLV